MKNKPGLLAMAILLTAAKPAWAVEALLWIGAAAGNPGDWVSVQVNLDTEGAEASAYQVMLLYDGAALTNPEVTFGGGTPGGWSKSSHSPAPGDTRAIALDTTASGKAIRGEIFQVRWKIAADASPGPIPIEATAAEVVGRNLIPLSIRSSGGSVTVSSPLREGPIQEDPARSIEEGPSSAPSPSHLPSVQEMPEEPIPAPVPSVGGDRKALAPRKKSSFPKDSQRSWYWFLKDNNPK